MATIVSAELKLWIYEGQPLTYSGTPNYTLNKTLIPGEDKILFETAELVKDYIDVYFVISWIYKFLCLIINNLYFFSSINNFFFINKEEYRYICKNFCNIFRKSN